MPSRSAAVPTREPRATRDLLLDAAEHYFAERGFTGVSTREIAAEAGLKNQASLYHYFRDKHALYEAVLSRGVADLVAAVRRPSSAAQAELDLVLDYLIEHPHLPRLIQRAGIEDDRRLRAIARRILEPLYTQGLGVIGARGGPWEAEDLPHVAAGLYHLIFGYFASAPLLEAVARTDTRSPQAVARQRRFVKTAVARLLGLRVTRRARRR